MLKSTRSYERDRRSALRCGGESKLKSTRSYERDHDDELPEIEEK